MAADVGAAAAGCAGAGTLACGARAGAAALPVPVPVAFGLLPGTVLLEDDDDDDDDDDMGASNRAGLNCLRVRAGTRVTKVTLERQGFSPALVCGNNRQDQRRRMFRIVIDDIRGGPEWLLRVYVFAGLQIAIASGVQVAVEARKVAAGNLQAQRVSFFEDIAGRPDVNVEFVYLPGRKQRRRLLRIAIAGAQNSFGQILREAVGPDVNQLGGKIRVYG